MSDVAASGGYYIACQADTIIAHPSTVTGSIGVIGTRLNLSKLMNKWGITSDLIKRGEYSDFASGNRLIKEEERKKIQESINETYSQFKDKVIKGRNISSDLDLDQVAMGRVFTGERAKNNIAIPLVDVNGGLHDAIELTKSIAGLTDKEVDIIEYPMPQDKLKEIAKNLAKFNKIEYKYNLPENLAREFEVFDIIPIMINDEIQVILPYDIKVQ